MDCEFTGRKDKFENFVLIDLGNLNGKVVQRNDELGNRGLGYDPTSVRQIGGALLQLAAEHGCNPRSPAPNEYDQCVTVGDLIDLLYGSL